MATEGRDVPVGEDLGSDSIPCRYSHHVHDTIDVQLTSSGPIAESVEMVRKAIEVSASMPSAQPHDAMLVLEALL